MQDRAGPKAKGTGLVLAPGASAAIVTPAPGHEGQEEKERKEASPLPGSRPPNL
jgi:hypothetical protein